jgi:hypothetical protein
VGKTPSAELTGRTNSVFTGYIEAVATTFKSPSMSLTLITGYIPPHYNCANRGAYDDQEFFTQLRLLYGRPLIFIADANADIISWTGIGTKTIRQMLADDWELLSSPAHPTSAKGRCIDIVLTRDFPYRCSVNVIPLSTNDHQGVHVNISSQEDNNGTPHACSRHAAIRLATCSTSPDHPHHDIATTALSRINAPPSITQASGQHIAPATQPLLQPGPQPIPHDPALCFDSIVAAVNSFAAAEKRHPYRSSDPLYAELKQQLQSHYLHRIKLARTTSHRVAHNLCRIINHAALQIRELSEKIRNRILSQDAISALELATKAANTNAITRRIEKALNPNKLVLNVADLSAEEAARHAKFWSDRWGHTFELPPDRLLNVHLHLHPPPGVTQPARFSITHRPNGDVWLPDADEVTTAIRRLSNHRAPGPSGIPVDFFKLTTDFT